MIKYGAALPGSGQAASDQSETFSIIDVTGSLCRNPSFGRVTHLDVGVLQSCSRAQWIMDPEAPASLLAPECLGLSNSPRSDGCFTLA
jgi:hypothetical protein